MPPAVIPAFKLIEHLEHDDSKKSRMFQNGTAFLSESQASGHAHILSIHVVQDGICSATPAAPSSLPGSMLKLVQKKP